MSVGNEYGNAQGTLLIWTNAPCLMCMCRGRDLDHEKHRISLKSLNATLSQKQVHKQCVERLAAHNYSVPTELQPNTAICIRSGLRPNHAKRANENRNNNIFIQQQTINYVFSFISTFLFWCNWESARAASSVTCRNCIYFNQTIPYNTQMRCEIANSLCCQTRQPRYSFTHESASFQKMYTRIFMIDEKLFPIRGQ